VRLEAGEPRPPEGIVHFDDASSKVSQQRVDDSVRRARP
jgi:hypothetical protein